MKKIDKPWGSETILFANEKYVAKRITINQGQRLSRQYHKVKDETILVEQGVLHLDLSRSDEEDRVYLYYPNETYRIKPGTVHRFCAPSTTSVVLLEVSTPELDDVVRLSDDYGRADA